MDFREWPCGRDGYEKSPPEAHSERRSVEITQPTSEGFDIEHLTVTIVAARRAGNVRGHFAATLGAALEDRCAPAVRATAHFLAAFGLATLWNGHGLALILGLILEVLEDVES
jgi:hypothetical protein